MECPICDKEMILAQATNFGSSYYYCRECKKELAEMSPSSPKAEPTVCKHSFSDSTLDCNKCGKSWYSMNTVGFWGGPPVDLNVRDCQHSIVHYIYHGVGSPLLTKKCTSCGATVL